VTVVFIVLHHIMFGIVCIIGVGRTELGLGMSFHLSQNDLHKIFRTIVENSVEVSVVSYK